MAEPHARRWNEVLIKQNGINNYPLHAKQVDMDAGTWGTSELRHI